MSTLKSTFQQLSLTKSSKAAYSYIRESDKLPTPDGLMYKHDGGDPVAKVKLFNPTGAASWYLAAYDPETGIAWGAAFIHEFEIGDIYMPELVEFRGRFGLPIERDLHWSPRPLSQCEGS